MSQGLLETQCALARSACLGFQPLKVRDESSGFDFGSDSIHTSDVLLDHAVCSETHAGMTRDLASCGSQ